MHVSVERCMRHYMRLQLHPQFRRTQFTLPAYNVCARLRASKSAYVSGRSARGSTSRAAAFSRVDPQHLTKLAEYYDKCQAARQRNAPRPPVPNDLVTQGIDAEFLRSVLYVTRSMPHTHARMMEARKEAHAYCFEFGKPTYFVTISKLDSACVEIKWLANERSEDATVMPPKSARYNLLAMYPGAAALSFDRLVRLFVKHMLQFDITKQRPFYDDDGALRKGIFGETVGFFGPFEEQARVSLHIHLLVFIKNMNCMNRRMHHPDAIARLKAHIASTIATGPLLPVAVQRLADTCPKCGRTAEWQLIEDWEKLRVAKPRRTSTARCLRCLHCSEAIVPDQHVRQAFNTVWATMVRDAPMRGTSRIREVDGLFTVAVAVQQRDDIAHGRALPVAARPPDSAAVSQTSRRGRRHRLPSRRAAAAAAVATPPRTRTPTYQLMDSTVLVAIVYHRLVQADPRSPSASDVDRILGAASVWSNQLHCDCHTFTCIKSRRAARTGLCRFCYPRPPVICTTITEADAHTAHTSSSPVVQSEPIPPDTRLLSDSDDSVSGQAVLANFNADIETKASAADGTAPVIATAHCTQDPDQHDEHALTDSSLSDVDTGSTASTAVLESHFAPAILPVPGLFFMPCCVQECTAANPCLTHASMHVCMYAVCAVTDLICVPRRAHACMCCDTLLYCADRSMPRPQWPLCPRGPRPARRACPHGLIRV